MKGTPRPKRTMKFMDSVVHAWPAMTRSPSFSRSGSSTTMIMRPALSSSRASGIEAKGDAIGFILRGERRGRRSRPDAGWKPALHLAPSPRFADLSRRERRRAWWTPSPRFADLSRGERRRRWWAPSPRFADLSRWERRRRWWAPSPRFADLSRWERRCRWPAPSPRFADLSRRGEETRVVDALTPLRGPLPEGEETRVAGALTPLRGPLPGGEGMRGSAWVWAWSSPRRSTGRSGGRQ